MTPRVAVSTPPEGCRLVVSPAPAREAPGDATRKWCCVGAIDREACLFCRFSRPLQNRFYLHTGAIATLHSAVPLLKEQVLEVEGSAITAIAFPDEGAQKRFGKMFGKLPQVLPRGCSTLFAKRGTRTRCTGFCGLWGILWLLAHHALSRVLMAKLPLVHSPTRPQPLLSCFCVVCVLCASWSRLRKETHNHHVNIADNNHTAILSCRSHAARSASERSAR